MVTKEQREELSREWNKGGDRHGGEGEEEILDLLDALDEMERERDAEREAGLRHYLAAAEMYVKLDAATQERDAAIASKIEWSQHANNRANERDEATLRAEKAERERDEAARLSHQYRNERDAALDGMQWRARRGEKVLAYFADTMLATSMTRGMDASGVLVERLGKRS